MKIANFFPANSILAHRSLHELAGLFGLIALVAVLPVSVGLVASLSGLASGPVAAVDVIDFAAKRIVSVQEARALIASGALVLDARDAEQRAAAPLPQAQPIAWSDLGPLADSEDDDKRTARLQALGLSAAQPVVVIGDPLLGTDNDARIVLGLRALGHHRSVLVNGGLPALLAAGLPTIYPPFGPGSFVVARQHDWQLAPGTLDDDRFQADIAVLDTGRAAHRAGSRQIPLNAFRATDGRAIDTAAIAQLLADHGIDDETRLVTYGSDGDGSAWVATLLLDLGYDVAGYVAAPAGAVAGQLGDAIPAVLN